MSAYQLQDVPNDDLIVRLKRLVGSSNELTAQLLAHLAEVDARGIYRDCACATLYTYCVYELRLSEDEAQRRCRAARVARQFPLLFEMLADGSIHLTGILLLAPHLTQENHAELFARARYRTKREIEKLVAEVAPCADAPSLTQALGLAAQGPASHLPAPSTWAALVRGWAGPVRQLASGDGCGQAPMGELAREESENAAPARETSAAPARQTIAAPARQTIDSAVADGSAAPALQRSDSAASRSLGAQRYKVQFTADQSYVDLLERARDLLQHEVSDRDLARVHRLAIDALLEKLCKRKYAARDAGRSAAPPGSEQFEPAASAARPAAPPDLTMTHTGRVDVVDVVEPVTAGTPASLNSARISRGRHIPSPIKRAVWERDGGRCTFSDVRGQRCRETALLEFHHRQAYAKGGPTALENVTLHCRSHNGLAAEDDYGRLFMNGKRAEGGAGDMPFGAGSGK